MNNNYNADVKKLIQELENPLAEIEEVMIKLNELNLSETEKKRILANLRKLGEIFEPRKDKLKTL